MPFFAIAFIFSVRLTLALAIFTNQPLQAHA